MRLRASVISFATVLLAAAAPVLADSVAVTAGGGHTSVTTDGKPCQVVTSKDHGSNKTTITSGNGAVSGSTTVSPGSGGSSVTVGSGSSSGPHGNSASAGSDCVVTQPEK